MRDAGPPAVAPTPYRVLATGIPLDMSPEAFYDSLRSYTTVTDSEGGSPVSLLHNALLLRVPRVSSASPSSSAPVGEGGRTPDATGGGQWQSTGAALVDFVSKSAANAVMDLSTTTTAASLFSSSASFVTAFALPSAVMSRRVSWEALGPVEAPPGSTAAALRRTHEAARLAGLRAYEAARWQQRPCEGAESDDREGHLPPVEPERPGKRPRPEQTNEAAARPPPSPEALPAASDSVEVVLACDGLPASFGPLWKQQPSTESALFFLLSTAFRQKLLLPGTAVHSLRRISDTRLSVSTDAYTAGFLRDQQSRQQPEQPFLTTTMRAAPATREARPARMPEGCTEKDGSSGGVIGDARLRWRVVLAPLSPLPFSLPLLGEALSQTREIPTDFASGSHGDDDRGEARECHALAAATIADVLAAMADVVALTDGRVGAFVDCCGNVVFPTPKKRTQRGNLNA